MKPRICERCKYYNDHYCEKRPLILFEKSVKLCEAKREAEQDLMEKIIVNFGKDK